MGDKEDQDLCLLSKFIGIVASLVQPFVHLSTICRSQKGRVAEINQGLKT